MKYNYVIWDWNGTLFEDMLICIIAMNKILESKGLNIISSIDEYRNKFCFPVKDYYQRLNLDFSIDSFENLANLYVENYLIEYKNAYLFQGVLEVLKELNYYEINQIIISASEQNILLEQIKQFNILNYFSDILGIDNNYAVSKVNLAKRWVNEHNVNLSEIILIGDTVHDYEVSKEIGCNCILISNGHQSKDILKTTSAKIIDNINEVTKYILE